MIRLFLFCLTISAFGLWATLSLGFPTDPGYLLIAFGNHTFETSLFAFLVLCGSVYFLFRILKVLINWIDLGRVFRVRKLLDDRKKDKAESAKVEGLIQILNGDWSAGYESLKKGMGAKDTDVITYIASSYAAFKSSKTDKWQQLLKEAEEKFPTYKSAIDLLHAKLLSETGQCDQARVILESLKGNSRYNARVTILLAELYLKLEDFESIEPLLPSLERDNLIDPEELEKIRVQIFKGKIRTLAEGNNFQNSPDAKNSLSAAWRKVPRKLSGNEELVLFYANILLRLGEGLESMRVIEKSISKKWSNRLTRFYGEHDFNRNSQQLITAEKWLKKSRNNEILFLTLARISLRNELWEKARGYYDSSLGVSPSPEAYLELSILQRKLGDERASTENLTQYRKLTATELSDLPLSI
mgnify:FL=1